MTKTKTRTYTVQQLAIALLQKFPLDATVKVEVREPYDEDAADLCDPLCNLVLSNGYWGKDGKGVGDVVVLSAIAGKYGNL